MKKHASIKTKLMLVMTLLVAGTIFVCWFFINTCLERYYIYQKQNELANSYIAIDQAGSENELESNEFALVFNKICSTRNIDTIIISAEREIILSYSPDDKAFRNQLVEMIWGVGSVEEKALRTTDHYVIRKQYDASAGSEYIALIGTLKNNDYIYMKTPLESIRESAKSTSQFFLFVGIGATILCVMIIYFVAKSISQPILELSNLSKRMCNLEFDAKFEPKFHSSRELQTLGSNMNELSETLQRTIGELKGANNELKDDIAKKEKIDEMRKEFLSNVSHELKTPLALISGYAEGLKECINDSEESREFYCDVIMDETDKMNRMVGKLLTLNQLEFGNERVEMSCFDITEMIRGVVNANTLLASSDGITISFAEEEPAYVWGDEFKVEEVITNYLSNAIHYAAGEKQIRIYYEQREGLLRVCVYNSGNTIPETELDKLWIKFYKVDKARTREYGGSGIGLSIVKAIMNSMHQECGVYNVSDGVVFWMELERNN
ncbi:MAG: HAMP domain-containing histidine kinase [Agathobacter sp.]|nr:HAMP domain-containing histidine kinase [Agathobacter sp.]